MALLVADSGEDSSVHFSLTSGVHFRSPAGLLDCESKSHRELGVFRLDHPW